jgi:hypothetical protein
LSGRICTAQTAPYKTDPPGQGPLGGNQGDKMLLFRKNIKTPEALFDKKGNNRLLAESRPVLCRWSRFKCKSGM